jgi:RTX calcium-binding nonapeptide repeat (4 copies)/Domain of unknown function (DUF5050)
MQKTRKSLLSSVRRNTAIAFEAMEQRQLMSASAIKAINSGGPDHMMVEAGGKLYVVSSEASGAGWELIYQTRGPANTTKLLVDLNKPGTTIASIDDLTATADGRVFFSATGGTGGGRQLYQLNTTTGSYTQITSDTQAFYSQTMAIGNTLYLYDSTHQKIVTVDVANKKTNLVTQKLVTKMFQAKGQLFFVSGNDGVWRSNGTAAGTYKISGNLSVGTSDVFVSTDWIYFEGAANNNNSLWRSDGSNGTPTKIADDFSFSVQRTAELGDYVYMSGGYYSTSPNSAGGQLYRIRSSTGEITAATNLPTSNGGGSPDGISAIGTHIYFTAGDTEFITSQGTPDRELYRYNTVTGTTTKITTQNTLYPIETGGGVLSSYYFVAAPTKDDARWGSRRLYRTSPTNDQVQEVAGMPSYTNSNGETQQLVDGFFAGSGGLYFEARNMDQGGDYDTYFVPTPYSYIDPNTNVLTIEATEASDELTITVDDDELVMNLNGLEERQKLADFGSIYVSLKAGDDELTTNATVTKGMSVAGDSGNDTMTTGSGNDSLLGGSGKNYFYGGNGDDRLRGSSGVDVMEGGAGKDRLYGRAGNDNLHGNDGVDVLYGDDESGPFGNDVLFGESSNDKLYGYGGDDAFYGGNQNDSIFAGDGNDTLYGQDGNDTLEGGAGIDTFWGGKGDDLFLAADGQLDKLYGQDGTDRAAKDTAESLVELIEL